MKFLLCSIVFSMVTFPLLAQEDSLINVYRSSPDDTTKVHTLSTLYNTYLYNDGPKAYNFVQESLMLSQKLNFEKGIARSLYQLGSYYYLYGTYDSAKHFYTQANQRFIDLNDKAAVADVNHGLAILEYSSGKYDSAIYLLDRNIFIYTNDIEDSVSLAITYDFKGLIHTFLGNYLLALNETLKALKILEAPGNEVRLADALNHLGAIEASLKNYHKSLEYNERALEIFIAENDLYFQAQVYNDIGNTFYYLDEYKNALTSLEKSVEISRAMGNAEMEATALTNMGKSYTALELYAEAEDVLNQSLSIVESNNNPNKVVETLLNLGEVANQTNQIEDALSFFNRALTIAKSIGVKENLRAAYHGRSLAYEEERNYFEALRDYREYARITDTLLNESKSRQIEELRTIYETEKKEQQIVLQQHEIDLLNKSARIRLLQITLLIGVLMLSFLAFYGVRQRLKRRTLEKEKIDAELAFKKKELTTHALHLARKNEVLEGLKQKAENLKSNASESNGYQQIIRTINFDLQDDNNWENFSRYFEQVHKDFNSRIKSRYPEITANELRLLALLKMNLSSKEIANILNISGEGIKKARYRLRKKLGITTEDSLQDLALNL